MEEPCLMNDLCMNILVRREQPVIFALRINLIGEIIQIYIWRVMFPSAAIILGTFFGVARKRDDTKKFGNVFLMNV